MIQITLEGWGNGRVGMQERLMVSVKMAIVAWSICVNVTVPDRVTSMKNMLAGYAG